MRRENVSYISYDIVHGQLRAFRALLLRKIFFSSSPTVPSVTLLRFNPTHRFDRGKTFQIISQLQYCSNATGYIRLRRESHVQEFVDRSKRNAGEDVTEGKALTRDITRIAKNAYSSYLKARRKLDRSKRSKASIYCWIVPVVKEIVFCF